MQGIHEDGVADANQVFEGTDITVPGKLQITYALCIFRNAVFQGVLGMPGMFKAPVPHGALFLLCTDAIVQEDGPYNAEPMHLPTVSADNYHQFVENHMSSVVYMCFGRKACSRLIFPSWCVCVCAGFASLLRKTDDRRLALYP